MTPVELKERLDRGDRLALLDVREDDERAYCSITPRQTVVDLHVPLGEVTDRVAEIHAGAESIPLVVFCHHGGRSEAAATWLASQGMADVHNLDGGIDAWSTQVDRSVPRY